MGAKPEWTLLLTALATGLCNPGSSYHFSVVDMSSQVMLSLMSTLAYVLLLHSPIAKELLIH